MASHKCWRRDLVTFCDACKLAFYGHHFFLQVYGLPTLILFKDGSMIKGSLNEGAITKPALVKYLEKYGVAKEVAK